MSEEKHRFSLELGVDNPETGRVCAIEMGTYETLIEAVNVAEYVRGSVAQTVLDTNAAAEIYDAGDGDLDREIVGCTLNVFTDEYGTVADYDLY